MKRAPLVAANPVCGAKWAPIEITPRLSSTYTGDQPWSMVATKTREALNPGALQLVVLRGSAVDRSQLAALTPQAAVNARPRCDNAGQMRRHGQLTDGN